MATEPIQKLSFLQRHPNLGKWLIFQSNQILPLDERKSQSAKILKDYPDKIPVICEPAEGSGLTLDRTK